MHGAGIKTNTMPCLLETPPNALSSNKGMDFTKAECCMHKHLYNGIESQLPCSHCLGQGEV